MAIYHESSVDNFKPLFGMRKATSRDIDFIYEMELMTVSDKTKKEYPNVPEFLRYDAEESWKHTWLIWLKDNPRVNVGIYQAYEIDDGEWWFIAEIALKPECRGKGIGTSIITDEMSKHDKIVLFVDMYNTKARRLYERLGFKKTAKEQNRYIMRWERSESVQEASIIESDEPGDHKVTFKVIKNVISKIHDKYKKDSKPPTGNQNCLLCAWCFLADWYGRILPRAVYSPRDPALDIKPEDMLIGKVHKVTAKDKRELLKRISDLSKHDDLAFWYCHVGWKGGTGGHEFVILNTWNEGTFVIDPQQGLFADVTSKEGRRYFDDANYSRTYAVRAEGSGHAKNINVDKLKEINRVDKIIQWDNKKDSLYLIKYQGMSKDDLIWGLEQGWFTVSDLEEIIKDGEIRSQTVKNIRDAIKEYESKKPIQEYSVKKEDSVYEAIGDAEPKKSKQISDLINSTISSGNKVWVMTDWHFLKFENGTITRHKNYDEIIKNCRIIKPDDLLIFLGDLVDGEVERKSEISRFIDQIPGVKVLVRGNNDLFPDTWYTSHGFKYVTPKFIWMNIIFSHRPTDHNNRMNIHGHIHGGKTYYTDDVSKYNNQLDVAWLGGRKTPIELKEVIRKLPEYKKEAKFIDHPFESNKHFQESYDDTDQRFRRVQYPSDEGEEYLKNDPEMKEYHEWFTDHPGDVVGEFLVDRENGNQIGHVFVWTNEENKGFIFNVNVSEEYRRQGYGWILVDDAVNRLGGRDLTVDCDNEPAVHLYLKYGFKIYKKGQWSYDPPKDEYWMKYDKASTDFQESYELIQEGTTYKDKHFRKLYFHVSGDEHLDGQVFKPRVPSYIEPGDTADTSTEFEDATIPRVCFSPTIEGAMNAIICKINPQHPVPYKRLAVYIPEKPFNDYKHKTNKEIIKEKLVFDASSTGEVWIMEPVRMKLFGIIEIDSYKRAKMVSNVKNNKGERSQKRYYIFKWHWLVNPKIFDDKNRPKYDTKSVITNLCYDLSRFKYGLIKNGRLDTNASNSDYNKYWVMHTGEEVDQAGGGICWDMVEYEAGYLEAYGIPCKKYFIACQYRNKYSTHTFVVVENNGKYIYIECAFKRVVDEIGYSKEFDNLNDIFDYVLECMCEQDNVPEFEYGIFDYTDATPTIGTNMQNFQKYIADNGKLVREGTFKFKKKEE